MSDMDCILETLQKLKDMKVSHFEYGCGDIMYKVTFWEELPDIDIASLTKPLPPKEPTEDEILYHSTGA